MTNTPHIPEQFIRDVWQRQLFTRTGLRTSDNKPIIILSPGKPNTDAGPDFIGARIRIGNTTFIGDVEIHCDESAWRAHGHHNDPHYNRVILHVVMTHNHLAPPARTHSHRLLPLLVLHPFCDTTLYAAWVQQLSEHLAESPLACSKVNNTVPERVILHTLDRLADERIELKVRRFEERLKALIDESKLVVREPYPRYYGNPEDIPIPKTPYTQKDFSQKQHWEQLLYEGIMEGLGYSKNQEPFLRLAQSMRLSVLRQFPLDDLDTMTALLFGAGGLLPSSRTLKEKGSRIFVRSLRKRWKSFRPQFRRPLLTAADWKFFRLRPNNFPTIRLAALCHLLPSLFDNEGFRRLISLFKFDGNNPQARLEQLRQLFTFSPAEYWRHHYRFEARSSKAITPLGTSRIHNLIVNAVIPILLLYARAFKDITVKTNARKILEVMPPEEENSVVSTVTQHLFKERISLGSALQQQGAMQLYKLYCSPIRCSECEIGRNCMLPQTTSVATHHHEVPYF